MKRRALIAVLVAAVSAALVTATLAIASSDPGSGRAQRPPEAAQSAALRATVTSQVVEESYVFSGKLAVASATRPVSSEGVVTALPLKGGGVPRAGAIVVEVNGRPVVGLTMPFPLWRDLTPGMEGKDVEAVQQALKELGYFKGNVTGTFAVSTQQAVERLFVHLKYSPASESDGAGSEAAAAGNGVAGGTGAGSGKTPGAGGPVDPKAGPAAVAVAKPDAVILRQAETAALGSGPWKLDLHGAVVGTTLGGEQLVSLRGGGTRLDVEDEGRLAEILKGRPSAVIALASGGASGTAAIKVLSADAVDRHSLVVLTPAALLEAGVASGSVSVRSTPSKVLALPVTALRPRPDGRTVVRLLVGAVGKDVPVTVGVRGDRLVEVRGPGLAIGATVELP